MTSKSNVDVLIHNVTKVFQPHLGKKKVAVDSLNLEVPQGKVVGLLGPNGSGKSTTLKMILGFLRPTSGTIQVCGEPVPSQKSRSFIGYLPENPRFPRFLSGRKLLRFYGNLLSLGGSFLETRIDYLLDLVGLQNAADERVRGYSKGMTQRLAIAQALLNQPKLLILDEPMSGLDPLARRDMRKLIGQIHQELNQSTIFFSSHILEDVEQLCSMVALLQNGKLARFEQVENLLRTEGNHFEVAVTSPTGIQMRTFPDTQSLVVFINDATHQGLKIHSVATNRIKLEESLFKNPGMISQASSHFPEVES